LLADRAVQVITPIAGPLGATDAEIRAAADNSTDGTGEAAFPAGSVTVTPDDASVNADLDAAGDLLAKQARAEAARLAVTLVRRNAATTLRTAAEVVMLPEERDDFDAAYWQQRAAQLVPAEVGDKLAAAETDAERNAIRQGVTDNLEPVVAEIRVDVTVSRANLLVEKAELRVNPKLSRSDMSAALRTKSAQAETPVDVTRNAKELLRTTDRVIDAVADKLNLRAVEDIPRFVPGRDRLIEERNKKIRDFLDALK
jgi:hypothetical protein